VSNLMPLTSRIQDFASREITFGEAGKNIVGKYGREAGHRIMAELVAGANEIRNEIILSMRNTPKSGRLYSRGYSKKGKPVMHRASSPGNPPAVDTGALLRSIIADARFTEVEVGSIITNPPYPIFLEKGSAKHRLEARPWLEPAFKKHEPGIRDNVRRVLNDIAEEMHR